MTTDCINHVAMKVIKSAFDYQALTSDETVSTEEQSKLLNYIRGVVSMAEAMKKLPEQQGGKQNDNN